MEKTENKLKLIKGNCGRKGCSITKILLPHLVLKVNYEKLLEEMKKAA